MRWKVAVIFLLFLCILLATLWAHSAIQLGQAEGIIGEYVAKELKAKDFIPGEYKKPEIKDAPVGSNPLLHVTGTVHYAPVVPVVPRVEGPANWSANTSVATVPAFVPHGNPCNLDELDVTIGCTVDAMSEPGKPWARLMAFGQIDGYGQSRTLQPMPAGEVTLQVAKAVAPPRFHLDFMAGASAGQRIGLEAGAAWTGKSRFGGYSLIEWQPSTSSTSFDSYSESFYANGSPATWRIHAGFRFRIK